MTLLYHQSLRQNKNPKAEVKMCAITFNLFDRFLCLPSLETGSDQLIVILYTLFNYPFVHNQLNRTLFEAHIVDYFLF